MAMVIPPEVVRYWLLMYLKVAPASVERIKRSPPIRMCAASNGSTQMTLHSSFVRLSGLETRAQVVPPSKDRYSAPSLTNTNAYARPGTERAKATLTLVAPLVIVPVRQVLPPSVLDATSPAAPPARIRFALLASNAKLSVSVE